MEYRGESLLEITEPQVFNPPKLLWVIDELDDEPEEQMVVAILANGRTHNVVVQSKTGEYKYYQSCFELIPNEPRRATNHELSRWLAEGKGQMRGTDELIYTSHQEYYEGEEDSPCYYGALVRRWGEKEWKEPTVEYLGLYA